MKNSLFRFALLVFALLPLSAAYAEEPVTTPPKPLKLLTIGNSFSNNAMVYFAQIAESNGKSVRYYRANKGGANLESHVKALQASEANPEDAAGRPYYKSAFYPPNKEALHNYSLKEALQADTWDYVTIQQLSNDSYKTESFEPFTTTLVDFIHQYAPQAKILLFETWAYREDSPNLAEAGMTQQQMADKIIDAYAKVAASHKLPIIPVGHAFQAARATERWHFTFPDPKFDYKNPPDGAVPKQPGSLNRGWNWNEKKDGKPIFTLDYKHCNSEGQYLIGAVFYEALFGEDVRKTPFVPDKMDPKDATELRRLAHETFASYQGTKTAADSQSSR